MEKHIKQNELRKISIIDDAYGHNHHLYLSKKSINNGYDHNHRLYFDYVYFKIVSGNGINDSYDHNHRLCVTYTRHPRVIVYASIE